LVKGGKGKGRAAEDPVQKLFCWSGEEKGKDGGTLLWREVLVWGERGWGRGKALKKRLLERKGAAGEKAILSQPFFFLGGVRGALHGERENTLKR